MRLRFCAVLCMFVILTGEELRARNAGVLGG